MVRALDVAQYMLYQLYLVGDNVTNLKLQKLLYFAQAEYLVRNKGRKLFKERLLIHYRYGVIVKEVYVRYSCFGRATIDDANLREDYWPSYAHDEEVRQAINRALEKYMSISACELARIIADAKPVREAPKLDKNDFTGVISTDAMYEYYDGLRREREALLAKMEEKEAIDENQDDSQLHIAGHSLNG